MADVKVKFLGDKTQISRTIKGIKTESQGIGGGFSRAGSALKGMRLPALAIGAAIFKLADQAGKTADALFDMQDQTGVSTDKLQEMRFVADQAGVAQDFYANSVKEVIKAQDELQKGTGPASEAMETLGVAVSNVDGTMRSAEAITDDVITRLQGIEDPTLRAALAQDIFKRKFEDILPVLGLGADAVKDMRDEANELGAVQSGEALTKANEYRKGMEKLQVALQDLANQIIQQLLPGLLKLTELLTGLVNIISGAKFEEFHDDLDRMNELMSEGFSEADALREVHGDLGAALTESGLEMQALIKAQEDGVIAAEAATLAADAEGDAFRESAFEGAAFAKAQRDGAVDVEALRVKLAGARQAVIDFAREQAAAANPVINLIRRTEDHEQALEDLATAEADSTTSADELQEARLRVVEAGGELEIAEATVLTSLDESTEGFIRQAVGAGLAADAVADLIGILDQFPTAVTSGAGGGNPDADILDARDLIGDPTPIAAATSITVNVTGGINTEDPTEIERFFGEIQEGLDRRNAEVS